jgi:hypothetical protein
MRKLLTLWIVLAAVGFASQSAPAHAFGCNGWPQIAAGNGCNSSIAPSGGGGSASFTFEGNVSVGTQSVSPFVVSGTFNTTASEVPLFAIANANDFAAGVITGISVIGPGTLTCQQGTNNSNEQSWLCYGTPGALTTASISIAFTGSLQAIGATGKITTATPTPSNTGASPGTLAGTTTPATFNATGGVPSSGVGVCVGGDFFTNTGPRTITSVGPVQDTIISLPGGNGQSLGLGHTTVAGGSSGVTFTTAPVSAFFSWACASWSP